MSRACAGEAHSLSEHARKRAVQRGATEDEIREAASSGSREPGRRGKWQARAEFLRPFRSPVDGKVYDGKTVEAIFADELGEIVVEAVS
jgi:hypothetical protein